MNAGGSPALRRPHPSPPPPSFLPPSFSPPHRHPTLRPDLGSTSSAGFHQPPQSTHRRPTAPITSTRGLAPVLGYSEDWLDQSVVNSRLSQTPNHYTDGLLQLWGNLVGTSEEPEEAVGSYQGVVENGQEPQMPPRSPRSVPNPRRARSEYVDLTEDSALSPLTTSTTRADTSRRKRRASGEEFGDDSDQDNKRHKPVPQERGTELRDLADDSTSTEENLLQRQQTDAIQSQHHEDNDGPAKLGRRTCIICMEHYTNATVTACGHIFCHECLIQALVAGEKNTDRGVGNCPVCRRPLPRKKNSHNIIPISFMKRNTFKGKRRQDGGYS